MMHNMGEGEPGNFEKGPEAIPTPEEVLSVFEKLLKGVEYETVRRLEDEQGLYLWDIIVSEEDGWTEYSYMRKGRYPEGQASATAVHILDLRGTVARWINGEWKMTP